jgi:hypothetical protein
MGLGSRIMGLGSRIMGLGSRIMAVDHVRKTRVFLKRTNP